MAVDLTILVCTFNRALDLHELLETALAQENDGTFTYEIIVVDNNSTDDTRAVVEAFLARGHRNLRYIFEGRQGKSYALNTGLAAAEGWIYTVADDDYILPPDWAKRIVNGFQVHPELAFVAGKILPLWQGAVPAWLGRDLWSAVAVLDYGDSPFYVDAHSPLCLLCPSFRRTEVQAVGGFRSDLSVSATLIGGVEDLEILQRLWKAGRRGMYLPGIVAHHKVQAGRLTKAYHRRWHTGHGRFYAILRDEEFERSVARLFDVPAHLYAQAAAAGLGWLKWRLWRPDSAFECETRVRFFAGFFRERRRQHRAAGGRGAIAELASFARALLGKRLRGASTAP